MQPSSPTPPTPVFVITMGDPAGIGPEIALKALCSASSSEYRVAIIGDLAVLQETVKRLAVSVSFNPVLDIRDSKPGAVNVVDLHQISLSDFTIGKAQAACGKAAYAYILKGLELATQGIAAGVITNPINKEAFRMGGINFPGHTEIFAEKTGVKDYSMLFFLDGVGVAHVTTHCSLRQAIELISKERVVSHTRLLDKAMKRLGKEHPRIAVGGLNPHAGENGLFGDEEQKFITPAVNQARAEGLNVEGPFPPDTVFMRAFRKEFDGVVCMLHDHGFVALKSRDFEHGVNITIGLPIIRTSVGHGTAFDKVGKGTASPESLITAIKMAWMLYKNREVA
jgi:4-hydroxythreonine-4-phosphate dehydrogenase